MHIYAYAYDVLFYYSTRSMHITSRSTTSSRVCIICILRSYYAYSSKSTSYARSMDNIHTSS